MERHSLSFNLYRAAQEIREQCGELERIESKVVLHNRVTPPDMVVLFGAVQRLIRINSNILTMQGKYIEDYESAVEERVRAEYRQNGVFVRLRRWLFG